MISRDDSAPFDYGDSQWEIRVNKSQHTLSLYKENILFKTYRVATGEGGPGDKQVEGDRKTPEGTFYITEKTVLSPPDYYLGTRWMRLSYPNCEDAERGLRDGLIDHRTYDEIVYAIDHGLTPPQQTPLGGGIGIHGGTGNNQETQGDHWTYGCLGLKDQDVNEIFDLVMVSTRVIIST